MLACGFGRRKACSAGDRPVSPRVGNLSDVYYGQYTRKSLLRLIYPVASMRVWQTESAIRPARPRSDRRHEHDHRRAKELMSPTRGVARTLRFTTPCTISEGPRGHVKPCRGPLAIFCLQNQLLFRQKAVQSDKLCLQRGDNLSSSINDLRASQLP